MKRIPRESLGCRTATLGESTRGPARSARPRLALASALVASSALAGCGVLPSPEPSNSMVPYYSCGYGPLTLESSAGHTQTANATSWKGFLINPPKWCHDKSRPCLVYIEILRYGVRYNNTPADADMPGAELYSREWASIPYFGNLGSFTVSKKEIVTTGGYGRDPVCVRNNPGVGDDVFGR